MTTPPGTPLYKRHRFPAEIISHGVWLYLRFSLSYCDVQEMMAERGFGNGSESTALGIPFALSRKMNASLVMRQFVNHMGKRENTCFFARGQIELMSNGTLHDTNTQKTIHNVIHKGKVARFFASTSDW